MKKQAHQGKPRPKSTSVIEIKLDDIPDVTTPSGPPKGVKGGVGIPMMMPMLGGIGPGALKKARPASTPMPLSPSDINEEEEAPSNTLKPSFALKKAPTSTPPAEVKW
ncbi:MAG: hypothetical protein ACK42K_04435, partial [Leptonema sp. (in: bacteria)]